MGHGCDRTLVGRVWHRSPNWRLWGAKDRTHGSSNKSPPATDDVTRMLIKMIFRWKFWKIYYIYIYYNYTYIYITLKKIRASVDSQKLQCWPYHVLHGRTQVGSTIHQLIVHFGFTHLFFMFQRKYWGIKFQMYPIWLTSSFQMGGKKPPVIDKDWQSHLPLHILQDRDAMSNCFLKDSHWFMVAFIKLSKLLQQLPLHWPGCICSHHRHYHLLLQNLHDHHHHNRHHNRHHNHLHHCVATATSSTTSSTIIIIIIITITIAIMIIFQIYIPLLSGVGGAFGASSFCMIRLVPMGCSGGPAVRMVAGCRSWFWRLSLTSLYGGNSLFLLSFAGLPVEYSGNSFHQ